MADKTSLISKRAITLLLLILAFSTTAHAKNIYVDDDVPADFNNIQAAIDNADNGDVIIVYPGTYTGDGNRDIDYKGKAITVRSIDPNDPNIITATIINCHVIGYGPHRGFHFHSGEDAHSVLAGFTITNGCAFYGGGIYCGSKASPPQPPPPEPPPPPPPPPPPLGSGGSQSSPEILAGYNFTGPTITNCIISGNQAIYGGGIYYEDSRPTITNCTITGNTANQNGGGIYCGWQPGPKPPPPPPPGAVASQSTPEILSEYDFPDHTIKNCIFSGNSAYWGGGMFNFSSNLTIDNCIFSKNTAHRGGGMFNISSNLTIVNCIFSKNTAHRGGGMDNGWSIKTTLENCIFWGNGIYGITGNAVDATYSDIEGGWPGEGNIDADPRFVDPGYWAANGEWLDDDYHLLPGSPCIDAGDPNYVAEPNETDLDGKPRVIGCRIDIGAYEYGQLEPAEARIVPRTINLANQGKWIMCYIWLPENYNVTNIDPNGIFLECEIEPEQLFVNKKEQVVIAKFSRKGVQGILDIGEVELTISIQLMDGTYFEGTDLIRVIYEGGGKLAELGEATNPNPADGATGIDINADLSWTAGSEATSHDVYFGTTSPPPFICNQLDTVFDPGTMVLRRTYYWRIDQINKWGKTPGQIWSFTTWPPPPPPPPPPP